MNKVVAIIGGGPVGLTMGRLLQQGGMAVKIFEREFDPSARVWGGTIDLHVQTGQRAFAKAGLLEEYFKRGTPMGRTITDTQGRVLFKVPPHDESPELDRTKFRKLLVESLEADTVVWDRNFQSLEAKDDKWVIHFENQPSETADVVIGANGGSSTVTQYVTDREVMFTGTYIIQGVLPLTADPEFVELCDHNIMMTSDDGIMFVANPTNHGALAYTVIFKTPDYWQDGKLGLNFQDHPSVIKFLSTKFAKWGKIFPQLFHSTEHFAGFPTRILHLDHVWKKDRPLPITLVGDAAHLMPPFAGLGTNIGLLDTLILSENMTSGRFDSVAQAIGDYEQQMFSYGRDAQLETLSSEKKLHNRDFSFARRFQQPQ